MVANNLVTLTEIVIFGLISSNCIGSFKKEKDVHKASASESLQQDKSSVFGLPLLKVSLNYF